MIINDIMSVADSLKVSPVDGSRRFRVVEMHRFNRVALGLT